MAPGLRFEVQVVAGIEVALAIEEQKAAAWWGGTILKSAKKERTTSFTNLGAVGVVL